MTGAGLDGRQRKAEVTAKPISKHTLKTSQRTRAAAESLFIVDRVNTAALAKLLSAQG